MIAFGPMINNNYHNSLVPCIQTSIPSLWIQRPFIQPQSSGIWRIKIQGKVVNSEEHVVKCPGQAPKCLFSLMENMEFVPGPDTSSLTDFMVIPILPKLVPSEEVDKDFAINPVPLVAVGKPDSGGKEGALIQLLANHFLVQFEPSQQIFHYDVDISPQPSKEVARHLKHKLVQENCVLLSNALPVFDGRKSLYSAAEFRKEKMEFIVSLPIKFSKILFSFNVGGHQLPNSDFQGGASSIDGKLFKVSLKIASKLDGKDLEEFLKNKKDHVDLPQEFIQALDVVLREKPTE